MGQLRGCARQVNPRQTSKRHVKLTAISLYHPVPDIAICQEGSSRACVLQAAERQQRSQPSDIFFFFFFSGEGLWVMTCLPWPQDPGCPPLCSGLLCSFAGPKALAYLCHDGVGVAGDSNGYAHCKQGTEAPRTSLYGELDSVLPTREAKRHPTAIRASIVS